MPSTTQIFQSQNAKRWRSFLLVLITLVLLTVFSFSVLLMAIFDKSEISLPHLINKNELYKKLLSPDKPVSVLESAESHLYHLACQKTKPSQILRDLKHQLFKEKNQQIRAGFYVNWDIQSFYSLRDNIDKMNMVLPEWFFVSDKNEVSIDIDAKAYRIMKSKHIKIIPMISNFWKNGWRGENVHRIISSAANRKVFINSVLAALDKYDFQGVNVDFEDLKESSDENLSLFQKEIYQALHAKGYLVTQDIAPFNPDYNLRELSQNNDFLFIMAYDQHYESSTPGPIAEHKWVESAIEYVASQVPSEKLVLCLAAYGYDWFNGGIGTDITYQEAITTAKESEGKIKFDNHNYNLNFDYYDDNNLKHQVYFTDAGTCYNAMRASADYALSGTALWRLGSEDHRIWSFYKQSLDLNLARFTPAFLENMEIVHPSNNFDYIGEGEVLDVLSSPKKGIISVKLDSTDKLIAEQTYQELPTSYVIKKYGKASPKQLLLTFDDGPDNRYTPAILDILEKENVPAAFFIVGMAAQNNIPILKRIYDDGFEIGNHTFTHPNLAEVSQERVRIELNTTRRLIESVTGHSTVLFRAPYNADSEPQTIQELSPVAMGRGDNYITVGESIDPTDWKENITAEQIFNKIISEKNNGNIILLHDAGGDRSATVKALPKIINYFKSQGYQFISVSQLLGKRKEDIMPAIKNGEDFWFSRFNWFTVTGVYWIEQSLAIIFFTAILLSIGRMLFVAFFAIIQKKKEINSPQRAPGIKPKVSIIVPAYNENINVVGTISNLLKTRYDDFEIVFVNDGSKDNTLELVQNSFSNNPLIKILTKANGGKASALNFGIQQASGTIMICIDADTQLKTDAIPLMIAYFEDEEVGAVAGNVKVGNEINWLTKWQSIEYITAQNFDKRAFDFLNCICVIPGAIGAFRKEVMIDAGLFTTDTLAEDCDITIRILKQGYTVRYCSEAKAFTEVPESVNMFLKQRFRWTFGIIQSFWKHRHACFNPKYRNLGIVALPNLLIFQIIIPLLGPVADMVMLVSLLAGSWKTILVYYLIFLIVDTIGSALAFSFENENMNRLKLLFPQRFAYRQLMYWVLIKAIVKAIKGELMNWGSLKRTGNVKLEEVET